VRILVYVLLGLAALWFALKFLANFTQWAKWLVDLLRNLWHSLFGGGSARTEAEQAGEEIQEAPAALWPFSAYQNPFLTGTQMSPEELVRYSFEAVHAFACERELGRGEEET